MQKRVRPMWQRLLLLALLALSSTMAFAQSKVSGKVVDATGEAVIGASVMIKGTSNGTVTNYDGEYTLQSVPQGATLVFSYVGYRTQNIAFAGQRQIDVTLEEDKQLLDEVVVVGYGVQRKSDVTGALTRVNEDQLNTRPVSNAIEALQGKAAGVDITTSERPGTLGSIRIRGNRSINASNEPLYVVDGVPLSSGGIESLNSRDIEAIDILKDASSTAIYGSRGANGVVLITTKRGKEGKLQLTYTGTMTFEKIVDKSPAFSASDYITWRRWAYYNASTDKSPYPRGDEPTLENDKKIFSGDDVAWKNIEKGWASGSWDGSKVTDTDWTDFVTQTGVTHEHTLRAQGGTKDMQASFSFGYLNNEGTQKGQEYERYNAAVTADVQATKWFKMGGKNYVSRSDDRHFSWTLDNMLMYNRTFGDHAIGLTLLHSASKYNAESSRLSEQGNPFPTFLWNNMGTGVDMASVRRDGSSVLSEGNKWDVFPSLALGWRMEQERWLRDVKWIDQLKLRFGVGVTGNSSGSNKLPNKKLSWEKTTQYNIGLDFSLLRGRINGAFEVYTSKTNDLLLAMSLPSLTGYPAMMDNIGKTKNKGFDLTLNFIPVQLNDFEWNSTINAAWQKDEIVELANGKQDDINNAWFIGESISVYYGFESAGLWQEGDQAEMDKFNANGAKFSAGNVRPVDQNGDYKIDADDRVILGNRNPRWTLGWSNSFSWKGLELNIDLFGRFKYKISTGGEGQLGMYQQREIDYYTPNNTGAEWQKPIYNQSGGDPYAGLLGFKDASFIKIRNLSLGYRLDKQLCNKIGISGAKLYVQGKNLGMLYSSVDFMDLDTGTTFYNRGFTVGLQLDF